MTDQGNREPMLDIFIYETSNLLEELEQTILINEKSSFYTPTAINEIFRIMHTIKGSAAIMLFESISTLAHTIEDVFYILRKEEELNVDYSTLSDLVLEGIDYIKVEIEKLKNGDDSDGDSSYLIQKIKEFLTDLKSSLTDDDLHSSSDGSEKTEEEPERQQFYISQKKEVVSPNYKNAFKAVLFFEEDCDMENIRAFIVLQGLKDFSTEIYHLPADLDDEGSINSIREDGFTVYLKTDSSYDEISEYFDKTLFLKSMEVRELEDDEVFPQVKEGKKTLDGSAVKKRDLPNSGEREGVRAREGEREIHQSTQQSLISVHVEKLDKLMNLTGEIVIAEAMVTENPDLKGLQLDNFHKAARQLRKITDELQDIVMSIRMVPLSSTFRKMHRIVRDMGKKLYKDVRLEISGEETEVDKNIIEHISDPLMHLVRNSVDHGIEPIEDRIALGKSRMGTVTLEAKNSGSDVVILIKDDGKGLNREKIIEKAKQNGVLKRSPEEMSDEEVYSLILLPGFSTKESVTEFSGRGVGMDVVTKNIKTIGGAVTIDSVPGMGTTITLKIPLTLAIIEGMNIKVGKSCYTIPTLTIKESFRGKEEDIIRDPDGNEMIMVRGECYPVLRLYQFYKVKTDITKISEGIIVMVEDAHNTLCIFVDQLLGKQQVVVKALPKYIKKIGGLAGCTLLGDGTISLIMDVAGLINSGTHKSKL